MGSENISSNAFGNLIDLIDQGRSISEIKHFLKENSADISEEMLKEASIKAVAKYQHTQEVNFLFLAEYTKEQAYQKFKKSNNINSADFQDIFYSYNERKWNLIQIAAGSRNKSAMDIIVVNELKKEYVSDENKFKYMHYDDKLPALQKTIKLSEIISFSTVLKCAPSIEAIREYSSSGFSALSLALYKNMNDPHVLKCLLEAGIYLYLDNFLNTNPDADIDFELDEILHLLDHNLVLHLTVKDTLKRIYKNVILPEKIFNNAVTQKNARIIEFYSEHHRYLVKDYIDKRLTKYALITEREKSEFKLFINLTCKFCSSYSDSYSKLLSIIESKNILQEFLPDLICSVSKSSEKNKVEILKYLLEKNTQLNLAFPEDCDWSKYSSVELKQILDYIKSKNNHSNLWVESLSKQLNLKLKVIEVGKKEAGIFNRVLNVFSNEDVLYRAIVADPFDQDVVSDILKDPETNLMELYDGLYAAEILANKNHSELVNKILHNKKFNPFNNISYIDEKSAEKFWKITSLYLNHSPEALLESEIYNKFFKIFVKIYFSAFDSSINKLNVDEFIKIPQVILKSMFRVINSGVNSKSEYTNFVIKILENNNSFDDDIILNALFFMINTNSESNNKIVINFIKNYHNDSLFNKTIHLNKFDPIQEKSSELSVNLLTWASYKNNTELIKSLLNKVARWNNKISLSINGDDNKFSSFSLAFYYSNIEILQLYLEKEYQKKDKEISFSSEKNFSEEDLENLLDTALEKSQFYFINILIQQPGFSTKLAEKAMKLFIDIIPDENREDYDEVLKVLLSKLMEKTIMENKIIFQVALRLDSEGLADLVAEKIDKESLVRMRIKEYEARIKMNSSGKHNPKDTKLKDDIEKDINDLLKNNKNHSSKIIPGLRVDNANLSFVSEIFKLHDKPIEEEQEKKRIADQEKFRIEREQENERKKIENLKEEEQEINWKKREVHKKSILNMLTHGFEKDEESDPLSEENLTAKLSSNTVKKATSVFNEYNFEKVSNEVEVHDPEISRKNSLSSISIKSEIQSSKKEYLKIPTDDDVNSIDELFEEEIPKDNIQLAAGFDDEETTIFYENKKPKAAPIPNSISEFSLDDEDVEDFLSPTLKFENEKLGGDQNSIEPENLDNLENSSISQTSDNEISSNIGDDISVHSEEIIPDSTVQEEKERDLEKKKKEELKKEELKKSEEKQKKLEEEKRNLAHKKEEEKRKKAEVEKNKKEEENKKLEKKKKMEEEKIKLEDEKKKQEQQKNEAKNVKLKEFNSSDLNTILKMLIELSIEHPELYSDVYEFTINIKEQYVNNIDNDVKVNVDILEKVNRYINAIENRSYVNYIKADLTRIYNDKLEQSLNNKIKIFKETFGVLSKGSITSKNYPDFLNQITTTPKDFVQIINDAASKKPLLASSIKNSLKKTIKNNNEKNEIPELAIQFMNETDEKADVWLDRYNKTDISTNLSNSALLFWVDTKCAKYLNDLEFKRVKDGDSEILGQKINKMKNLSKILNDKTISEEEKITNFYQELKNEETKPILVNHRRGAFQTMRTLLKKMGWKCPKILKSEGEQLKAELMSNMAPRHIKLNALSIR